MIPLAKPLIGEEEKQAVLEVLESGMIMQGPRVEAFEEAFAEMCGVAHAVATTSGTTALHLALLAHGIGPGDEVITSAFTFISTANTVLFTGAKPVFVDIDPSTFTLNPKALEDTITERTRAIIPVHLYGLPADMDPITRIASAHDLAVIEDACQAHGATYHGKAAGSFGTGSFSFYPTKNITSAEGGMITTDDPEIAHLCKLRRQHGMLRRYYQDDIGFNYRMTDIHAAIGLAQLPKLAAFNAARIAHARYYSENLEDVITPIVPEGRRHVFHQYTIRVPGGKRDALAEHLRQSDIGFGIYYPVPIHRQTYYTQVLGYDLSLPETERASAEVLSLPVHPALSEEDLATVVSAVNTFMAAV